MTQLTSPGTRLHAETRQITVPEPRATGAGTIQPFAGDSGLPPSASPDLTRIRYGAWLIVAAFLMLGIVFGVAVLRYPSAMDVAAVVGTLSTVTGTILGAYFGAQVGSAGKEAAEAGRRKAERTANIALSNLHPSVAERIQHHL